MTVSSGFFNSVDGDRLYDANSFNDFFDGFLTEGVLSPVGGWLQITPGGGMHVSVSAGKAWFRNTWVKNSQPLLLKIDEADVNFDRNDLVILDFNKEARVNNIIVLTGEPDQNPETPELIDTYERLQVPLARIFVEAESTTVEANDIINKIGVDPQTPFATGLLQQASVEDLMAQWVSDYLNWKNGIIEDLEEIDTTGTLVELAEMRERLLKNRNIILNGAFSINQVGRDDVQDYGPGGYTVWNNYIIDRWAFLVNQGKLNLDHRDTGDGKYTYRVTVSDSASPLDATAYVALQQVIEASRFADVQKGTADAKSLVLSWGFQTNRAGNYTAELWDVHNNRSISYSWYHPGNNSNYPQIWVIPPDFTGEIRPDESRGVKLTFWLAAGSNYTSGDELNSEWVSTEPNTNKRAYGQSNGMSTVGGYFDISDVQLEIGKIKSPFERRPFGDELNECQRYAEYHEEYWSTGQGWNNVDSDLIYMFGRPYRARKRVIPTFYGLRPTIYDNAGESGWSTMDDFIFNEGDELHKEYPALYFRSTVTLTDAKIYWLKFDEFYIDAEMPASVQTV